MMRILQRLERTDGAEIAEVALVLPLVFMFLMGIVWFGRAFNIYSTITHAAEQGAMVAARPTCGTCIQPADQWGSTNFPGDTTVQDSVFSVLRSSSLDPSQIVVYFPSVISCPLPAPPGNCSTTGNNITICRSVVLNPTGTVPQCGSIVSFQYPFQMNLPFTSLNLQQIVLKAQAQNRMEN
ncbi:MAG: pilus assembly protein [Acidobacteria bacterium]|nr:pilus assembly protein [Acidobacteriota bacterium]